MSDQNNNANSFNLPAYIQIPLFLYQDDRLEKSATIIASFFYSLHTAGLKITASTDYLCELAKVEKRQLYNILNLLDNCNYTRRSGFTNRKKIEWIYQPNSSITVLELDTGALDCTSVEKPNNDLVKNPTLVHSSAVNLCTPVHTDTKEDTKVSKKTSTRNPEPPKTSSDPLSEPPSSSLSSFFSSEQQKRILEQKLPQDSRSNSEFLGNALYHIQNNSKPDLHKNQRIAGLVIILAKCKANGELFKARGYTPENKTEEIRIPTQEDFDNYVRCAPGYDWVRAATQRQKQA